MKWTGLLVIVALVACSEESARLPEEDGTSDAAGDPDAPVADVDAVADTPDSDLDGGDVDRPDFGGPTTCLSPEGADASGTGELVDGLDTATVTVAERDVCYRRYSLATTAVLRDGLPASPRTFDETAGAPTLRSGNDLFDALYALALAEVGENSVEAIRNGAFNGNEPYTCPAGGCFETGRLWTYVWTRDMAYATHLALADLDPVRARNSLLFKVSERRGGGSPQIVQDTGSGGSYPVSSDRVVWAYGARAVMNQLPAAAREAFVVDAYAALRNTVEHDRSVLFEAGQGLYSGETSFLDWREQTYPGWTEQHVIDIATSRALSTNVAHLTALALAGELARELGEASAAARYTGWHDELEVAIREAFWLDEEGMLAAYLPNFLDPAPVRRYDALGAALAILEGVVDEDQARRMLESYPSYGPGVPVIWPQQQRTRIYHNRAEWPFVTAYWLRAAARADHDAVATRLVESLIRGAALNLSNMENFEAASGAPWVEDGLYSGPVVNSQRQLWSVAGYVSMVHHTVFGLHPDARALTVAPYLTTALRDRLFAGTDTLVLNDWPFREVTVTVVLHLPPTGAPTGSYRVAELRLNDVVRPLSGTTGASVLDDELASANRIDVFLAAPTSASGAVTTVVSDADWRAVFGPRTPVIDALNEVDGRLVLEMRVPDEDTATLTLDVYRDGVRVASGLGGGTASWTDPTSDPNASPCYAVEATFTDSGNHSQHSRATCWWGTSGEHIQTAPATDFEAVGGTLVDNHGRWHYENWGGSGDSLAVQGVVPGRTGEHLVQVTYGNGSGPLNTGITCAVKQVSVVDEADQSVVARGLLVMPQLGVWSRWADSSFVRAPLEVGHTYTIRIGDGPGAENMSSFAHFAGFGGSGGVGGPYNVVNIAEIRVLAR